MASLAEIARATVTKVLLVFLVSRVVLLVVFYWPSVSNFGQVTMGDDYSTRLIRENRLAVWTEQGPRTYQEDAHLLYARRSITVVAVFDGHGGAAVSKELVRAFGECLDALVIAGLPSSPESWVRAIESMFDDVDLKLRKSIHALELLHVGSTATMAFVVPDHTGQSGKWVFVANTGDSKTVVYSATQNAVVMETREHKPDDPVEARRIHAVGSFVTEARQYYKDTVARVAGILATSRAFGDDGVGPGAISHSPDVSGPWHVPATGKHFVIVASDGLTDVLDVETMIRPAVHSRCSDKTTTCTAADVCNILQKEALDAGLVDNISVVVLEL